MEKSKVCRKCRKRKSLKMFYALATMRDGHFNKCKECYKNDVKRNRLKNLEYYRAYDRERAKVPSRRKAASAISKAWRQADARRTAAHNAVTRAIRSGRLTRMDCEKCGRRDAFAHHESYDRKLDVRWLCQPCHKQRHKEMVLAGIEP